MATSKGPGCPRRSRELARTLLTGVLFALVLFTIEIAFLAAFYLQGVGDWPRIEELVRVVLPVEAALLVVALRFYFHASKAE
jgi:hypothetical protein